MGESIICKGQRYLLNTEDAQIGFLGDLMETMDRPLFEYLSKIAEDKVIYGFFKKFILDVLEGMNPPEDSELDNLRSYCHEFHRTLAPSKVFRALYFHRRKLYDKYLLRISEETAFDIMMFVVKKYEKQHNTWFDYPAPYISDGEMVFMKEKMEEIDAGRNKETPPES